MKKVIPTIVAALCFLLAQTSWAQVNLKDGRLHYSSGSASKSLTLEKGAVNKVLHSNLVWVLVMDEDFLKAVDKEPGIFFFDAQGIFKGSYAGRDGFDPEMCMAASMSPGGKVLALDNGAWLVRIWAFLNYPDFTEISAIEEPFISYLSDETNPANDLGWIDDKTVIVTDISEAPISRPCPADPCEPLDVVVHFLDTWRSVAVAKGDELCNYRFNSLSGSNVTVEKICTKKIDDWGEIEKFKTLSTMTRETLPIPSRP